MTTNDTHERRAGGRQITAGVVLLVLGALVAALLVKGGADTLAAVGYVVAVAGVVLVGNGVVLRRKGPTPTRR